MPTPCCAAASGNVRRLYRKVLSSEALRVRTSFDVRSLKRGTQRKFALRSLQLLGNARGKTQNKGWETQHHHAQGYIGICSSDNYNADRNIAINTAASVKSPVLPAQAWLLALGASDGLDAMHCQRSSSRAQLYRPHGGLAL